MTTLTHQDIHWPDLDLPPINLWSAPRMNQCDGCQRGLPVKDGIHHGEGYDMIGCTAERYKPITQWSCNGHTITCTRGHLSASVVAPIDGWYTDAREWTRDVLTALRIAEGKLWDLEYKQRA